MPRFRYDAFDVNGRMRSGELEAADEAAVQRSLSQNGLVLLELSSHRASPSRERPADTAPWWKRELGREKPPDLRETAHMVRELATLVDAGMPLDAALGVIGGRGGGRSTMRCRRLRDRVRAGKSLAEAMRMEAQPFADDIVAAVQAGETASELKATLNRLSAQLLRKLQVRTELYSALIYPAVLIAMSIAVFAVVIGVLIPNIKPLFADSRVPVPMMITWLDVIHSAAAEWWHVILLSLAAGAVAVRAALRSSNARLPLDRFVLRVPGLSTAVRRRSTAAFARTLGAQLISGVPILAAMSSAAEQIHNFQIRALASSAIAMVRDGASPSEAFQESAALLPVAAQLMAVGENTGRFGPVLLVVAETLERDEQESIKRMMALLTPLLTIGIGLLVGLMMMSVMTAIGGLNDAAF